MAISKTTTLHTAYKCKAVEESENIKKNIKIPKNTELKIFPHGKSTKIRWKNNRKTIRIIIQEDSYSLLEKLKPLTL